MLESLELLNFRAFRHLRTDGFGRVNLLVGRNNSGKTSVLEAIEMLVGGGTINSLLKSVRRRGEILTRQEEQQAAGLEISHLFHGHRFDIGSKFSLRGVNNRTIRMDCEVVPWSKDPTRQVTLFEFGEDSPISLTLRHSDRKDAFALPISRSGAVTNEVVRRISVFERDVISEVRQAKGSPSHFVTADSVNAVTMGALWDAIALTAEEEQVIRALQIIEPDIERIAFLSTEVARLERRTTGGILVKLRNYEARLPLGSMGDGVKRLLTLSLSLIRSQDGYSLIDEIDTGLHHSVMSKMWEMVVEIARRLNVQVFATTHSQDCVNSLASLYQSKPDVCSDIRLHRIENGLDHSIGYSPRELEEASKHHMEIRGW